MRAMLAILWSFFGVRKGADWQTDMESLRPAQVIVAGLIGAALFVLVLLLLVRWIVA